MKTKNKTYFLLLILVLAIFSSCVTENTSLKSKANQREIFDSPSSIIGKWLVENTQQKILITYFPDNTYTIEFNSEVVEVGLFDFNTTSITNKPGLVFNRDTGKLQKTPEDQVVIIEYSIAGDELTLRNYDTFKYDGPINDDIANALTTLQDSIAINARKNVLSTQKEHFNDPNSYFTYDNSRTNEVYNRDQFPENILGIEELNLNHNAFQNNNPYGFKENIAYKPFIQGKVVQWLSDSCLYDFAGVASNQLYWECLGLVVFEGLSKSDFSDQKITLFFEYIGIFNYTTVNNVPKIIPKFRVIYYRK